jgi:hypothetical protein
LCGIRGTLSELVLDARRVVPGDAVSTMNADMPFLPAALSVSANTIATSAFLPEVMNCLVPFST